MQDALSKGEAMDFAFREAQALHLESFAGGDIGTTLITLYVTIGILALLFVICAAIWKCWI